VRCAHSFQLQGHPDAPYLGGFVERLLSAPAPLRATSSKLALSNVAVPKMSMEVSAVEQLMSQSAQVHNERNPMRLSNCRWESPQWVFLAIVLV